MFCVKIMIVGGRFVGWQGFATGWVLTQDAEGTPMAPRLSLAASFPLIEESGILTYEKAERYHAAFVAHGGYEAQIVSVEEARKMAPGMEEANRGICR